MERLAEGRLSRDAADAGNGSSSKPRARAKGAEGEGGDSEEERERVKAENAQPPSFYDADLSKWELKFQAARDQRHLEK